VVPVRRIWATLSWGALGFISGAIFWHVIGFWTFVSDAVLDRAPPATAHLASAAIAADRDDSVALIYHVDPANCTGLELDRRSNVTAISPCPYDGMALRLVPGGDREDSATLTQRKIQSAGYRTAD
jgi:hypothetical protein